MPKFHISRVFRYHDYNIRAVTIPFLVSTKEDKLYILINFYIFNRKSLVIYSNAKFYSYYSITIIFIEYIQMGVQWNDLRNKDRRYSQFNTRNSHVDQLNLAVIY